MINADNVTYTVILFYTVDVSAEAGVGSSPVSHHVCISPFPYK